MPNLVATNRYEMWLGMEEMLTWNPKQDVAKPYPPKPVALKVSDAILRGRDSSTH